MSRLAKGIKVARRVLVMDIDELRDRHNSPVNARRLARMLVEGMAERNPTSAFVFSRGDRVIDGYIPPPKARS